LRSHSAIRIAIFAISSPTGVDVSIPSLDAQEGAADRDELVDEEASLARGPERAVASEDDDGVEPPTPRVLEDLVDDLPVLRRSAHALLDKARGHVPAARLYVPARARVLGECAVEALRYCGAQQS
jgi:hypothetical protein